MLTLRHDDLGNSDTYKVIHVKCESVGTDSNRMNITVTTPEGDLKFRIGSDSNSKVEDVAPRIAKAVDGDITIYLDKDRYYLYATDNDLPDDDFSQQLKITGEKGHYAE